MHELVRVPCLDESMVHCSLPVATQPCHARRTHHEQAPGPEIPSRIRQCLLSELPGSPPLSPYALPDTQHWVSLGWGAPREYTQVLQTCSVS